MLYEIGTLDPGLIADYFPEFLKLLKSKDNRMLWGAMIGLAAIADRHPKEIWEQIDDVIRITESGTVITLVWGIRTLARVAAADKKYKKKIFPFLLKQIRGCLARDVPTHAESILCAVDQNNKGELLATLEARRGGLTPAQLTALRKCSSTSTIFDLPGRLFWCSNRIDQSPQALDLNLDTVTSHQGSHSRRGAGENDIPCFECHHG